MPLQSLADEIIIVEPMEASMLDGSLGDNKMTLVPLHEPLEVSEPNLQHEHEHGHDHEHEHKHNPDHDKDSDILEVSDLIIDDILGAPPGTPDPAPPAPAIEVTEDLVQDKDKADDSKSKKNEKWDWESKGSHGFIPWVKEKIQSVPKHSGYDSAGLERAIAYLERLDNEISRAMRLDLDGELDANQIEKVRAQIDNGVERLHDRLDKVKQSKKKSRKKKAEYQLELPEGLVKEAQKITGVQGVYVTVPLLISRIARVCINGMVSAGHDIEDLYERQVKFYKLNDREQAEVMQLLADMGYAVRQDRGFMPDQDIDVADSDNMDWAANYKG